MSELMAHCGTEKISRYDLIGLPTPEATRTHQPIPHHRIVNALIETLSFRNIRVVRDEYAVSPDAMRMFGVLDLSTEWNQVRFSIGLRNANDKSMRLGLTVGYRVFVCDNLAFDGDFTPILAKHSAKLDIIDTIAIGVEKMQRNFKPMTQRIGQWIESPLSDDAAKLILYEAFVEGELEAPKQLLSSVHTHYFTPGYKEFSDRSLWSLSNAFTSAFKELKPISQYRATAKLAPFLQRFALPGPTQVIDAAAPSDLHLIEGPDEQTILSAIA